ncbi:MAG: GAF domain-containing protein, partial [Dehalococcoidia bacterium]|nr:GAF domain-containing protein [Dehalococcoidia bacterium]
DSSATNVSSLPFIQRLFQTGRPSIELVAPGGTDKAPEIALGVPLWSRGVVVGVIAGELSLARVGLDTLPAPNLGPTGRSELIDETGFVIASSGGNISFVDHVVVLKDRLEKRQAGITIHQMSPGSTRPDHIVAYAPLTTLPWGIIVEQDEDVALALPQELQRNMLLAGLLAVVAAGIVAWVGVRRLVEPLRTLTLASQRIAAGDLDNPVGIKRSDEMGALASSFEAMRAKLKLSLEEIRRWNEELEQRVEKRTRELERRNQELSVINSVAETVNRSLELEEVLKGALDQVLAITEAEVGSISLRDERNGLLSRRVYRASDGVPSGEFCPNIEECLCGRVAQVGESLIACVPQAGGWDKVACLQNGFKSLVILPLKAKDKVRGVLYLASSKPDHFSSSEQRLLAAISHQIGIAVENARLYGEIQQREDMRRQLLAKVISAQEEERKRIARELHDESAQALTALIMSIQAAQEALPDGLDREKERLARTKAQAIHALVEMRQMILDLRPTALDDLGLVPAIRWYTEAHLQPLGIRSAVEAVGIKRRLPPEIETSLFRISQEAINNVAKHSKAKEASIRLEIGEEEVRCKVEDDGVGFDVGTYLSHKGTDQGLGLLGVRERVSLLGGSLAIESSPGKGTCVGVIIPIRGG